MKKKYIITIITLFLIGNINACASSGRLKKDSIKTCNGITYGQHGSDNHWHIAEKKGDYYYATEDSIYINPCSSNENFNNNQNNSNNSSTNNPNINNDINKPSNNTNNNSNKNSNNNTSNSSNNASSNNKNFKSDDNNLKTIIIDEKEIEIKDIIEFSTNKETINISAFTNDDKASFEIKNNTTLSVGLNEILIEVTAENGNTKTYTINVTRELILSSDTGIELSINGTLIEFDNYKAKTFVNSSTFNLEYKLSEKNAKIDMNTIDSLNIGDNELNIIVIAEDGTNQEYQIIIHRFSKAENVLYSILSILFIGGIGYGVYYVVKKIKCRNNIENNKNIYKSDDFER